MGALFGIYKEGIGRMYFSNSSYPGYNDGEYIDAIDPYTLGNKGKIVRRKYYAISGVQIGDNYERLLWQLA